MTARIETLGDGDTFTHEGLQFIVSIEYDENHGAPWDEGDGHGPVSQWTGRNKKPGEWVLSKNRGLKRFYDAARVELAEMLGRSPTNGDIRAEAVRRDFEHLRRWCNDQWHYVGVCVRHVSQDAGERYGCARWGIESDSVTYIAEVAHELAWECAKTIMADIEATRETPKGPKL